MCSRQGAHKKLKESPQEPLLRPTTLPVPLPLDASLTSDTGASGAGFAELSPFMTSDRDSSQACILSALIYGITRKQ